MDCDSFHVTLFSEKASNPETAQSSFTCVLAQPLDLGTAGDRWEVGLCEISTAPTCTAIYTPASVDISNVIQCLRTIIAPSQVREHRFQNVFYMPLYKTRFSDIHIELRTPQGRLFKFKDIRYPTKVVLHFRRINQPCVTY